MFRNVPLWFRLFGKQTDFSVGVFVPSWSRGSPWVNLSYFSCSFGWLWVRVIQSVSYWAPFCFKHVLFKYLHHRLLHVLILLSLFIDAKIVFFKLNACGRWSVRSCIRILKSAAAFIVQNGSTQSKQWNWHCQEQCQQSCRRQLCNQSLESCPHLPWDCRVFQTFGQR